MHSHQLAFDGNAFSFYVIILFFKKTNPAISSIFNKLIVKPIEFCIIRFFHFRS